MQQKIVAEGGGSGSDGEHWGDEGLQMGRGNAEGEVKREVWEYLVRKSRFLTREGRGFGMTVFFVRGFPRVGRFLVDVEVVVLRPANGGGLRTTEFWGHMWLGRKVCGATGAEECVVRWTWRAASEGVPYNDRRGEEKTRTLERHKGAAPGARTWDCGDGGIVKDHRLKPVLLGGYSASGLRLGIPGGLPRRCRRR